jgi:hypothetical protein
MKKTFTSVVWIATVAGLNLGCLVRDTTETIYLEPDGGFTWTVLESDVRSDEKTPAARAREDANYIAAAIDERHPIALAFSPLGPVDVRTHVLRAERPYTVLTIARFARFDMVMERFGAAIGGTATSVLERRDGLVSWIWTVGEDGAPAQPKDEGVQALADSFERCRFVLSVGHFVSADGFELSDDKRVATLRIPEQPSTANPAAPLRFELTWTEGEK